MTHEEFQTTDMERLVERRIAIQESIFRLWRFGRKYLKTLPDPDLTLFHLLVGVVFSLWRAAFLVQGERSQETLNNDALAFLGVLSWDNAISYTQDRSKKAWTVGYYLNNAHHRLRSAEGFLDLSTKEKALFIRIRKFLSTQTKHGNQVPDAQAGWDDAHRAYRMAYQQLRRKHIPSKARTRG